MHNYHGNKEHDGHQVEMNF